VKQPKLLLFPAVLAIFFACGEVEGDFDFKSASSGSRNCTGKNCISSSSRENSSSSFINIEIGLDLITQGQYEAFMGTNPSKGAKNDTLPVEGVNWFKAREFCEKIDAELPTEAEWIDWFTKGLIQINTDYWEWTNDCIDKILPNCLETDYKVLKGFNKKFDEHHAENPYADNIGGGYISFRCSKKKFLN